MHSNKISIVIGLIIFFLNICLLVIYVQKQLDATIQFAESLLRLTFRSQSDAVGKAKNHLTKLICFDIILSCCAITISILAHVKTKCSTT